MIVCPNCNHQNPDEAVHCEACYTPLPTTTHCPNCNATIQSDASFCGQCGFNLQSGAAVETPSAASPASGYSAALSADVPITGMPSEIKPLPSAPVTPTPNLSSMPDVAIPDLPVPDPIVPPDPLIAEFESKPTMEVNPPPSSTPAPLTPPPLSSNPPSAASAVPPAVAQSPPRPMPQGTILQTQVARLLHVQTNTPVELPSTLAVIHVGKPNDRVPPDVDISGFPNSEIVSRVHADIRVEGDIYYIEDVGSANGTYINNMPLPPGNRHRLRPGDRIALGKGDKVTFLFQLA